MMKKQHRNGRRLHLVPLVAGGCITAVGLGSVVVGLFGLTKGIGFILTLYGLAVTGFGMLGVWDGVRDLVVPDKKMEITPARQFILTDVDGKCSSNVTIEILRTQLDLLVERNSRDGIHLQILPPVFDQEKGELKLISWLYHSCIDEDTIMVLAFFKHPEEGIWTWQKEPDQAEDVLRQALEGRLDFTEWEKSTIEIQNESPTGGSRKCLHLFGENWENRLQFFSIRDVELAVKGIADGKYCRMELKLELELGVVAFYVCLSDEDRFVMVLHMLIWSEGELRAFEKTGNAVQVNFWLVQMLNEGLPTQLHDWKDITASTK